LSRFGCKDLDRAEFMTYSIKNLMQVNTIFGVYYGTLYSSAKFDGLRKYVAQNNWQRVIGRLFVAAVFGVVCMLLTLTEDSIANEYLMSIVAAMLPYFLAFFCIFGFADKVCASVPIKVRCWLQEVPENEEKPAEEA